jgi:hypothetical protein
MHIKTLLAGLATGYLAGRLLPARRARRVAGAPRPVPVARVVIDDVAAEDWQQLEEKIGMSLDMPAALVLLGLQRKWGVDFYSIPHLPERGTTAPDGLDEEKKASNRQGFAKWLVQTGRLNEGHE